MRDWLRGYGYRPIRMPLVEPTPLFARAIGEVTDIVEKEMYSFIDSLNGEQLTLRPEGTASCVRAVLQHNLLYDSPQRCGTWARCSATSGRRRAATASSTRSASRRSAFAGPDIDAEQILMCARLWDDLGPGRHPAGDQFARPAEERARHRADLIAYLEQHRDAARRRGQRRLHTNPLRILDTKNPAMQDTGRRRRRN